jgi:hypothetical protein
MFRVSPRHSLGTVAKICLRMALRITRFRGPLGPTVSIAMERDVFYTQSIAPLLELRGAVFLANRDQIWE